MLKHHQQKSDDDNDFLEKKSDLAQEIEEKVSTRL